VVGRTILEWLRRAQQESKRLEAVIPKWLARSFGIVAMGLFVALAITSLGKRPYIAFLAFWVFFAFLQTRARKLYPLTPNVAVVVGWFFLASMAVFIGFMVYRTEFVQQ
jgi:hypothetical protein